MTVQINGESRRLEEGTTLAGLLSNLGLHAERVAVEVNLNIVEKERYAGSLLKEGDKVEIIGFVGGGGLMEEDALEIGKVRLKSRLIVGTGKYKDFEETKRAVEASVFSNFK